MRGLLLLVMFIVYLTAVIVGRKVVNKPDK